MARIMAFDFGEKRVGVAVTDPLQIIASPLDTIETSKIMDFLAEYLKKETIEKLVIGLPINLDSSDTHGTQIVRDFVEKFKKAYPAITLITVDERFTSSIAKATILASGIGKMKRREKKLIDKVSASLILQTYLGM